MATNKYGIDSKLWSQMSPEDQNQVIADYNKAHQVAYTPPAIGGYVQPTSAQVTKTLQQSGLNQQTQTNVQQAYQGNPAAVTPTQTKPGFVFAVNMATTWPPYEDMRANGQTLVVVADDPNADRLIAGAREHGVTVAIQVNAPNGITPQEYAQRVADAKSRWNPDRLVLDIEDPGKGYAGSAGWNWSQEAAPLIAGAAGDTATTVTMPPLQDDYNYSAYSQIGADFWVQAYLGDMTPVDAATAMQRLVANGVDPTKITPIVGPNGSVQDRQYATWGIPGATTTTGPGKGPGTVQDVPPTVGQKPTTSTTTPTTPGVGPSTITGGGDDWAASYFGSFGLPTDVANQVNAIFKKYPDTDQAINFALAYIRGTPWYKQTFAGIDYGIQHGLVTNEQDYRQYVTSLDTLSMRYNNRHISGDEVTSYLYQGLTPDIIAKKFQGQAGVQAYGQDWNYYLGAFDQGGQTNQAGLSAIGEQSAGLDSALGQKMSKALNQAMTTYSKLFEGSSASGSLSLGNSGLSSPSLKGGQGKPDIAA